MAKVGLIVQAMQRSVGEERKGMRPVQKIGVSWVKLNTDGTSKGCPGQAGAGGIIRGSCGRSIGMYATNCGIASSTRAEFLAVLKGLALAWNTGQRKVVLEVDSVVVVCTLLGEDIPSSLYYHIIRRCKEMISKQAWVVEVQHCYSEANRAADWLANYGVGLNPKLGIMEAAPPSL